MFDIFTLAMKFDLFIFEQFSKLLLIFDFNFWQSSPPTPWIYVSKDALNHFLVHSSAKKNSLRRAKNVVFFVFWMVARPTGKGGGGGGGL